MNTESPWLLSAADIDWSEGLPRSRAVGDIYFSTTDGLAETRHVFLAGNGLPQRWASHPRPTFSVTETGFGTGLNVLALWQAWDAWRNQGHPSFSNWGHPPNQGAEDSGGHNQGHPPNPGGPDIDIGDTHLSAGCPTPGAQWLHITSIEKFPLRPADLARAHAAFPELAPWAQRLQAAYPPLLRGHHYRHWPDARLSLHLVFADAHDALLELFDSPQDTAPARIDAWFLDGFAPRQDAALWDPALFRLMRALSAPGATLATFSAAGEVRRALAEAGFAVQRQPGFGSKRHMSVARAGDTAYPASVPATRYQKTGDASALALPARYGDRHACVIGAGLAGLFTAHSLACRGWQVTVLEAGSVAAAASGNRQGILFHRASREDGPVARFSQQAFLSSAHLYRDAVAQGWLPPQALHSEGMLQLPTDAADASRLADLAALFAAAPGLLAWLDAAAASAVAGTALPGPALHWPASATVSPQAICTALAGRPGIRLHTGVTVQSLQHDGHGWQLWDATGSIMATAPVVVIASGTASTAFAQTAWLPLKPLRGQVSHLPATAASTPLRCAVCHDGYITPAHAGLHCIGASFDLNNDSPLLSKASHRDNLQRLQHHWPAMHTALAPHDTHAEPAGRVGFRCTSPDYLPAVGAVPDAADPRTLLPGLYLNSGHGSRGLTYAPLAGELLASLIEGSTRPLDPALCRALAPARFLLRAARRGRTPA